MNVFLRTLVRRWPIFLVVVVLAGGSTYAMLNRVGPTYQSVGSTLIFPPADVDGPGPELSGGNPYLELSGLTQARDIVIRTLTSKTVRADVEESFPGMSFEATPDFTNNAPIVLFTVEASTPEATTQALIELMGRVPATLAKLQENQALADRARITSLALTEDVEPTVVRKDQIRAGILAGAGSLGVGLLMIALLDGLLGVRRRRREELVKSGAAPSAEVLQTPRTNAATASTQKASVRLKIRQALARRRQRGRDVTPVTATEVSQTPVREEVPTVSLDAESGGERSDEAVAFPITTAYLTAIHELRPDMDITDGDVSDGPRGTIQSDDDQPTVSSVHPRVAAVAAAPATKVGATAFESRLVSVVKIRRARDHDLSEAPITPSTRQHEVRGTR